MSDPFKKGDEAREKYMEQALHANDAAAGGAKFTDLINKDSSVYKDQNPAPKKEAAPLPPKPTVDAEGYPIIEQMRTFKADLADIVNKDKLSLSRMAMMEGTANKGLVKDTEVPKKKPVNVFLISSIALIVVGVGIVGGVLALLIQKNAKEEYVPEANAPAEHYIIFSESKETLNIENLTKTQLGALLKNMQTDFKEEDSVMQVIPTLSEATTTREKATVQNLFDRAGLRMPDSLARTLVPEFFLGIYSKQGISYPFLIHYVDSYDIAYPGMLSWEGFLADDMNWLFPLPPKTGTTTPSLTFHDRVIANQDARSFEDENGKTAFFYMFLDNHTILYAKTADTVRMVLGRLRQAKFQ